MKNSWKDYLRNPKNRSTVDVDVRPIDLHEQDAADSDGIGPLDDDQAGWNVPQFVLPWTREEDHEEEPVHPLFQTGTFRCDDHID